MCVFPKFISLLLFRKATKKYFLYGWDIIRVYPPTIIIKGRHRKKDVAFLVVEPQKYPPPWTFFSLPFLPLSNFKFSKIHFEANYQV